MGSAFDHSPSITVPGAGNSTNNALVRWSGTGGKTFLDSTIIVGATTMGLAADTDLLTFGDTTLAITGAITGVTALTVDNLTLNGNTLTATSGAVNITPAGGSAIVLDGTINVDAGVVTGATSITSTEFHGGGGNLTGISAGPTITGTTSGNQIMTANSATELNGEANLTFDGANLYLINSATSSSSNLMVNSSATSTATPARLILRVGDGNTGDAFITFHNQTGGGAEWAMGLDNSDSNKIKLGYGGTVDSNTRLTIQTDGDIGIGITAPVNKLMIVETKNNNTNPTFHISNPTWNDTNVHNYGLYMYQNNAGTGVIGNNNGDRINISTAGNVGIGIASPSKKLHIVGDGFLYENLSDSADEDSASFLVAVKNYSDEFGSIRFEDRRGTQAQPSFIFAAEDGSGGTACFLIKTGTTSTRFQLNQNGDITGTHGSYHTSSDSRAKENIVNSTVGLDAVMQMRPVKFNFIADRGVGTNTRVGFIAQEVEALIPEAVFTADTPNDPIPNIKSIEDPQLIPVLVKAIQELNAKVDALS